MDKIFNTKTLTVYQNDIDTIIGMVKNMEEGNEPVIFKICMGSATQDEINEWALSEGLEPDQVDEVIEQLKLSFTEGTQMAETINNPSDDSNIEILDKLDIIMDQLNDIRKEINSIYKIINKQ